MNELRDPFLVEISLRNANVVLVEKIIAAAKDAAGRSWAGVSFGVPLFDAHADDAEDE